MRKGFQEEARFDQSLENGQSTDTQGFPCGENCRRERHSKGAVMLEHKCNEGKDGAEAGWEGRPSLGPEHLSEPTVSSLGSSWIVAKHIQDSRSRKMCLKENKAARGDSGNGIWGSTSRSRE